MTAPTEVWDGIELDDLRPRFCIVCSRNLGLDRLPSGVSCPGPVQRARGASVRRARSMKDWTSSRGRRGRTASWADRVVGPVVDPVLLAALLEPHGVLRLVPVG